MFLGHGATPAQSRTSTLEEKMNAGFHNMQTSYDVLLDEVRALRQLVERHLSDTADDNTMQEPFYNRSSQSLLPACVALVTVSPLV